MAHDAWSFNADKFVVGAEQAPAAEHDSLLPSTQELQKKRASLRSDSHLLIGVLLLAATALLTSGTMTLSDHSRVLAFLAFEVAVGMYCEPILTIKQNVPLR